MAEASVTGDLEHPNIVPVYDLGTNDAGALFYSMKRVRGTPWMDVLPSQSLPENIEILMKVADAVALAHSRAVVHRDLKPENVMLGDFGEVLVMDWGLAYVTADFRRADSITQSNSMGGTPAYMAPEMATGPIERVGFPSDVYLLGAVLYEVITGEPPHAGDNIMNCLYAVAQNEIQPTERSGELVEIALKAMSTAVEDRYATVQEFQQAVRDYQSHSESVILSVRAEEDLTQAGTSHDYDDFARAVFGFREAIELWSGNDKAVEGLSRARLAYATQAMKKGDLDLAASLLDQANSAHAELATTIRKAQQERAARLQRLKNTRRTFAATAALFVVGVVTALVFVNSARQEAVLAEESATRQMHRANEAEADARDKEVQAREAETAAKESATQAAESAANAREQTRLARAAEAAAAEARDQETELRKKTEYDAYIAQIGLVSALVEENSFGRAVETLDACAPEYRNWEWGRLMHLCRQSRRTFMHDAPVMSVDLSPDAGRAISGDQDGIVKIWETASGAELVTIRHGTIVNAVAFSPNGMQVVTGSNDEAGEVRIWDSETGELIQSFDAHTAPVTSVQFSRDGKRLLTGSYDQTARMWDVDSAEELRQFAGHTWWVWSARFSPDESSIVTASHDGTALIWSVESAAKSLPFRGHTGPVYHAAFSPDGRYIASAGYDKQVLLWETAGREPGTQRIDFEALLSSEPAAQVPDYQVIEGHSGPVLWVEFLKDGKQVMSAGRDNTIKIWDIERGLFVETLRGHAGWVSAAVASRDGRVLSGSSDQEAKIWDLSGSHDTRVLRVAGHDDVILDAAFSPAANQIVTASRDRTAKVWDFPAGTLKETLTEGHALLISSVSFSRDGERVLTGAGTGDNTVRVWNRRSTTELVRLTNTGPNGVAALSPDGTLVATGGTDQTVQWWDAASGDLVRRLEGHAGDVTAVRFSPDGKLLASADAAGRGFVWSVETGEPIHHLRGHTRKISAIAFLPGGKQLLSASTDQTVARWDLSTGEEDTSGLMRHPREVVAMDVSADGSQALTSCLDENVRLWDVARAEVLATFPIPGATVTAVSFSLDRRRALTASSDQIVRLWDLQAGQEVTKPTDDGDAQSFLDVRAKGASVWAAAFSPDGLQVLTGGGRVARIWDVDTSSELQSFSSHGAVASARFSPNGSRIVTGSWDNTARIWDAQTGKAISKLTGGHTGYINAVRYSPDGSTILSVADDATAKLWDAEAGEVTLTLTGHTDRVRDGAFSADGGRIVTASNDETARIWDAATGELLHVLQGHTWAVVSAEFSTDGTTIITGSDDNAATLWNAETGEVIRQLKGHTAGVASVAFAPDGLRALTGSRDTTVKLWDTQTGVEVLTLRGHTQEVTSVGFSPDGRYVMTGGRDGAAIVWLAVEVER